MYAIWIGNEPVRVFGTVTSHGWLNWRNEPSPGDVESGCTRPGGFCAWSERGAYEPDPDRPGYLRSSVLPAMVPTDDE